MSAAELKFENPPSGSPSWLSLAQAVFNEQASRWDNGTCGGGLRWQIFTFNTGYDYKNTISNGGFFQLAARLGRYTQNDTYIDWANKTWDWYEQTELFDLAKWQINDGSSTLNNCSDASHIQWTYNYGTWIAGAAYLYNHVSLRLQDHRFDADFDCSDWKPSLAHPTRWSSQYHSCHILPGWYGPKHHGRGLMRAIRKLRRRPAVFQSILITMACRHSSAGAGVLRPYL